jgi:hypothetical protein
MLVLFDNGTPRTLARYLISHHAVTEARAQGWDRLENGDLLNAAEASGFEVFITTDKTFAINRIFRAAKLLSWLSAKAVGVSSSCTFKKSWKLSILRSRAHSRK